VTGSEGIGPHLMGWSGFAAAWGMFVLTHFLPSRRGWRDRLILRLGRRSYFAAYGAVSLLVLIWLVVAAGRAPQVMLWWPADWHRRVPNLVVPLAFVLAAGGMGMRYPWSLGGRRQARFDPGHPGLAALTRHPLLWALALWSLSHVVPNGDLAHVLLFGGFAGMALAAIPMFDGRARRAMSAQEWQEVCAATAIFTLRPLVDRAWRGDNARHLLPRAAIGLALYLVALILHEPVIGVTPLAL
jgi:uncharacterized membrane protein